MNEDLPVYKVCGAVHRVDDPRGFVSQDARLPLRHGLFPDKTASSKSSHVSTFATHACMCASLRMLTSVCPLQTRLWETQWWFSPPSRQSWWRDPQWSSSSWLGSHARQLSEFPDQIHKFGQIVIPLDSHAEVNYTCTLILFNLLTLFLLKTSLQETDKGVNTSPAFLATSTAKSYALCHGSSIVSLRGACSGVCGQ